MRHGVFLITLILLIGIAACVDTVPSDTEDPGDDIGTGGDDADGGASGGTDDTDGSDATDPGSNSGIDADGDTTNEPRDEPAGEIEYGLLGTYFDSRTGEALFTRVDDAPSFLWLRTGSEPTGSSPPDLFAVVWEGSIIAEPGTYRFTAFGDDGVRVFIEGENVMGADAWSRWMPGVTSSERLFTSGSVELDGVHDVRIEFFQYDAEAEIRLNWSRNGAVSEPVPSSALRPSETSSAQLPYGVVDAYGGQATNLEADGSTEAPDDGSSSDDASSDDPYVPDEPAPAPSGDVEDVSFVVDTTTDFRNPERGWMIRELHDSNAFETARDGDPDNRVGYTVVWSYMRGTPWTGSSGNPFRLDNYRNQDIDPDDRIHDALDDVFAAARDAGVKMKIRFAYNYGSTGQDTDLDQMLAHIGQLAPTINENKDVIAAMDAGFVGRWGEWNYEKDTVGNLVRDLPGGSGNTKWWTEPYLSAYVDVHGTLLEEIDEDIMIMMRHPRNDRGYRLQFDGSSPDRPQWNEFDPNDRFSGSDQSRVGWYNDCLWASIDHAGTFDYDGGELGVDREAAALMGRYAATSGETCDVGGVNSENDGSNVVDDMEYLGGPDHLYRKFYEPIYDKWEDSGHYNEISRRLGYRLALDTMRYPSGVTRGEQNSVRLTMRNDGFGKVYNPRPMELVLSSGSSEYRVRLTDDARRQLPLAGEESTFTYAFTVPTSVPTGTYDVGLSLPDPSARLSSDARYAIKLANDDMWESDDAWDTSTGVNDLGVRMVVE